MTVRVKTGLAMVLALYIVLAFVVSQVTPFNKGPDEETNLAYTEFIVETGRLPITYAERELVGKDANWPAFYHFMVGGISRAAQIEIGDAPYIKEYWDSFRYRAIDVGEDWFYLRTEDQSWPFSGRILVMHIGRWLSIVFGVITLGLVYAVIREVIPDQPEVALFGVTLLAFIPTFIFMSGVMNEDMLMAALMVLYLWMLIRIVKQPQLMWPYWVLGLALGVSVTVKYTTIILPVEVVVVISVIAWQARYNWLWWLKRITVVGLTSVLAASWWFGWNFWYLNRIDEFGFISGLLYPIFAGGPDVTLSRLGYFLSGGDIGLSELPQARQSTLVSWAYHTYRSFWAISAGGVIPWEFFAFAVIGIVLVVAAFGLWQLWRTDSSSRKWLLLLSFHIALFIILPLLRFFLSRRIGETAQGRHILIPAAAAVIILILWGLVKAIPTQWHLRVFSAISIGLILWTSVSISHLATFAAPPVPMRTVPQAATWLSHPVNAKFGDAVELVSYDVVPNPKVGSLNLSLAWRALGHISENYRLQVEVVDQQQQVKSRWIGYHGNGQLPTLSWDPGDSVFDRLNLPLSDFTADSYEIRVSLLGQNGPLSVNDQDSNSLALTTIQLDEPTQISFPQQLTVTTPNQSASITFAIWQSDGPIESSERVAFRYPATISIVVSDQHFDETTLRVRLIDPDGNKHDVEQTRVTPYNFIIGPDWPSGDYRLHVTLEQQGQSIGQATSQPLIAVENWWEREFDVPDIQVPLQANFADQLKFLGYKLPETKIRAGESLPITLYWQAMPDQPPQANFIQFNHLLDSQGNLRGGYDRRPLEYYSTLLWAPGEVVVDGYTIPVDADAPPGEYYLNVGYYLIVGESAVNLPLVVEGQMTESSSVSIGPIQVVQP